MVRNSSAEGLKPIRHPNKHQQKTELTRRKLIKAAMRIFARDGFEAARIEDIAAEAGHSRGAFYANFETKEDLFFALLEVQSSERIDELARSLESCSAVEDRIAIVRDSYLNRALDRQWAMLALEFKLFALRHGKKRAKLAESHRRIRQSLNFQIIGDLLSESRRWDPGAEESRKATLEAVLSGLVIEHAYDPQRISVSQVKEMLGLVFDTLVPGS